MRCETLGILKIISNETLKAYYMYTVKYVSLNICSMLDQFLLRGVFVNFIYPPIGNNCKSVKYK